AERRPDLPAAGLVDLPRRATERDHDRPRLLGERRSLDAGMGEDERAGRRVHPLAVQLERRMAAVDEVQLLAAIIRLIVLVDDPVARIRGGKRVDAERCDAQVVPDW